MQINFHQKGLRLSDSKKDYISGKIESLDRYKLMDDSSVIVRVDVEFNEHADTNKKIFMSVTVEVPKSELRAEADCISVEEGIDLIEPKLVQQLEKNKTAHQ